MHIYTHNMTVCIPIHTLHSAVHVYMLIIMHRIDMQTQPYTQVYILQNTRGSGMYIALHS